MARPIDFRHRQCGRRDIGGVDSRAGEAVREENSETARAGAQVERRCHGPGAGNPGGQIFAQQAGNMGARHYHALVHVKGEVAEPGFARQVRGGLAAADAAREQGQHAPRLERTEPAPEHGRSAIQGQAQCVQREIRGFVAGGGGAVTENEARLAKAAGPEAHQRAYRPAARRHYRSVEF